MIHCTPIASIYYNSGNGYTVASYETEEELPAQVMDKKKGIAGQFTAVGIELPTGTGLELDLEGEWKSSSYGFQYEVSNFHVNMPTTKEGIKAYLSSNLIKGIGPVTAEKIVEKFGVNTFHVLDNTPEKLMDIRGITETKLEEILDGYHKSNTIRELTVYLAPLGVTPNKIAKIQEHFGNAAISIVKQNPFRLCEIRGFGFLTVDPIAVKSQNFKPDNPLRIKAAISHVMKEAEADGHLYLSSQEIVEKTEKLLNHKIKKGEGVSERAIKNAGNDMIHKDKDLIANAGGIYTKKSFEAEMGAAAVLAKLCLQEQKGIDVRHLLKEVQQKEKINLNEKQQEAVLNVFENPVSIITGGPGRGKTTIIRVIIAIQEALDKEAMILLCAPTGKARRRMYESTGYPAMTIHKAIGLTGEDGEEEWNGLGKMNDDLIIADEFSMVDMYLADKLFSCIKNGARLVMVGDKDQIESVGPGNVFKEMIESGIVPVTVLDECFRQEENSTIISNADRINHNQTSLVYDDTFRFYPAADAKSAAEIIKKLYEKEWRANKKDIDKVQVLSPFRKDTEAGSDALNAHLREIVNPKRRGYPEVVNGKNTFRQRDKVMQTKNNDEISNGDVGEVLNIYKEDGKNMMRVDFGDDRVMEYDGSDFLPLTHAYAMSVHKSQGSEYPVVILPMLPCFRRMLRRNILYTAVTRAKKTVIIVGSKRAIAQAIKTDNVNKRNTKFGLRLRKVAELMLREERKSA